jgi:hypothetical protein
MLITDFINIKVAVRERGVMSGIVQRILEAKVSAPDMKRAFEAVHALSPEDRTDIAARVVCLIELFGEPGQHEVSARVAAIDWRYQALARLSDQPEFKNWSLPGLDGGTEIAPTVLEAAVTEPLIAVDGKPSFDADRFFNRLLTSTKEQGHG